MNFNFNFKITSRRCYRSLLLLSLAIGSLSVNAAPWKESHFNPKPLDNDVVLPFPCEGSMVFRKVAIPLNQPLEDYNITLGQDGDNWGYLEQSRSEYIAGSFSDQSSRYYLVEKYPVTDLQYAAMESVINKKACPTPTTKLRLPKVNVSWMEAMLFADRYNQWLLENHPEALPIEDGVKGFLRLPTETEWEFAARGGLVVSSSEFRDLRFPMPEGVRQYMWSSGSQSANGHLQLTGQLSPNPLGLHDMLGNVSEMMFEPFRLNKLARQHGQAGGFIVRGGNFQLPESDISSAWRQEVPYYSSTGVTRTNSMGFRLVLVAPTLTSSQRIKEIEAAWLALGEGHDSGKDHAQETTIQNLNAISSSVQDEALKKQLSALKNELKNNALLRDEQRNQAIRTSLQLGAFLCTKLKDDGDFYDRLVSLYHTSCPENNTNPVCERRAEQLNEHKEVLEFVVGYYADTLVDMGQIYDLSLVKPQVNVVQQLMEERGKSNLNQYLATYMTHLETYWKNGKISRSEWLQQCQQK